MLTRSFSAVTRRTCPRYSTVLWEIAAKDSASTSISSPVRKASSILNSRLVSLSSEMRLVMVFSGLTIRLPSTTDPVSSSRIAVTSKTLMVAREWPTLSR